MLVMCLSRTNPPIATGTDAYDLRPQPVTESLEAPPTHAKEQLQTSQAASQSQRPTEGDDNPARWGPQPTVDADPYAPKPGRLRAAQLWMRKEGNKPGGFANTGNGLGMVMT